MTERNLTQELLYTNYIDMEDGDDVESIDYRSLIHIMTEMMTRIEALEKDKQPWAHPESGLAKKFDSEEKCD